MAIIHLLASAALGDYVQLTAAVIERCSIAVGPDNLTQSEERCIHCFSSPFELPPAARRGKIFSYLLQLHIHLFVHLSQVCFGKEKTDQPETQKVEITCLTQS